MNCELCQNKEAVVHFKHALNGEVREVHLCSECAAKKGFVTNLSPASLTDFLFGMDAREKVDNSVPEIICRNCQMRRSDFRKTSRFGCASCYEVFAEDLGPLIDDFQKGNRHVGKVPVRQRNAVEISALEKKLHQAVESQNYEEAAKIRDAIRGLKSGGRVSKESVRKE